VLKKIKKINMVCCMSYYPTNGRVDFEDSLIIKSSFITEDEIMTGPKANKKKEQKKLK
jgi:hypothetical protein